MSGALVYTFRTFPHMEKLNRQFPQLVVLGKLKDDLQSLQAIIKRTKPDFILGVAAAESARSVFEPITINRFHTHGTVMRGGADMLSLHVPPIDGTRFHISSKPTRSFCNYSTYAVKHLLERENLGISFSFVHVREEDIPLLPAVVERR